MYNIQQPIKLGNVIILVPLGTHPLTDFDGFPYFGLGQVHDKFFSSFNVNNEGNGDTRYTYLRLKYFQPLKFKVACFGPSIPNSI